MPSLLWPLTTYRHMGRYRQVVRVSVKYGFGGLINRLGIRGPLKVERRLLHRRTASVAHLTRAQRFRMGLEELGPTFVKLGQFASTRPDMVSAEFIPELERLQSHVAPLPPGLARSVVESELGHPATEVFASFEDEPVASASLSQVHRATLPNGDVVAVKVQRPGIAKVISLDLEIISNLAGLMEASVQQAREMNLTGLVREFAADIKRELDFRLELRNLHRFSLNFADDFHVHVPKTHDELCTSRVLVMEFLNGIFISDKDRLMAEGYDLKTIARRGVDLAMKSAIEHGFFHADPHPGNILILPDNNIGLVDFGMMGVLSPRDRHSLAKLLSGIASSDERRMSRALTELSDRHEKVFPEDLELEVWNLAQQHLASPVGVSLGDFLQELLRLNRSHHLMLRSHLVWLLKAIANIEEVARRLYPEFNMIEATKPYAEKLLKRHLGLSAQLHDIGYAGLDLLELIKVLPTEGRDVLRQLRDGKAKIEFQHVGLEPTRRTIQSVINRLSLAILIGCTLVASSLIVYSGVRPLVGGTSVIGVIGYVFAGVLAFALIISMLRSGRY